MVNYPTQTFTKPGFLLIDVNCPITSIAIDPASLPLTTPIIHKIGVDTSYLYPRWISYSVGCPRTTQTVALTSTLTPHSFLTLDQTTPESEFITITGGTFPEAMKTYDFTVTPTITDHLGTSFSTAPYTF